MPVGATQAAFPSAAVQARAHPTVKVDGLAVPAFGLCGIIGADVRLEPAKRPVPESMTGMQSR